MSCTERTNLCNIKDRRRSCVVVKENNYATVIVDRNQGWKKHLLVVPDAHSENISQVDEVTWKEGLGPLIAWTIRQLRKDREIAGFHINTNAGLDAHQSVLHTHIHIVPTYRNAYRNVNNVDIKGFSEDFLGSSEAGYYAYKTEEWDTKENIVEEWKKLFELLKSHLKHCKDQSFLKEGNKGELIPFHVFARIDEINGINWKNPTFHFIPNPHRTSPREFKWKERIVNYFPNITELGKIRDEILALSQNIPPPPPDPDITLRLAAINAVKTHWNNNQIAGKINGKDQPTVLTANWKTAFAALTGDAINNERDRLIALIDAAKTTDPNRPNPPNTSKDQLQREIDNCNKWVDWEKNYQKILSFNLQEQKELKNNLLNNLLKIIGLYTDLKNLDRLETSYKVHQFYTENTDEVRNQIDQFCSNHRKEIEKNNSSQSPQNSPFFARFWPIILIILFLAAALIFLIQQRKKSKLKK